MKKLYPNPTFATRNHHYQRTQQHPMKIINAKEEVDQNDSNFNFSNILILYVELRRLLNSKSKNSCIHTYYTEYTPQNFMVFARQNALEKCFKICDNVATTPWSTDGVWVFLFHQKYGKF